MEKSNCVCMGCKFIDMVNNMENLNDALKARDYYFNVIKGNLISNRVDKALNKINYKLSQVKI